jgi:hypothetical protein
MRNAPVIAFLVLSLTACGYYRLTETERHKVADLYTAEPQIAWNGTKAHHFELWTANGPRLEALRFFNSIKD